IELVEAYCKQQGLWRTDETPEPVFTDLLELDLSTVRPSLAGPKRPQDRVLLTDMKSTHQLLMSTTGKDSQQRVPVSGEGFDLGRGDVVSAAITSCTSTSNPRVLRAARLRARKAVEQGLARKPWVKSSLAPGSKVVVDYLAKAGPESYLQQVGFNLP